MLCTAKTPYVNRRAIYRKVAEATSTTLHMFPHGGMGDRILLEGILRRRLAERLEGERIILVIPNHAGQYDAQAYRTHPDELWVAQDPGPLELAREELTRAGELYFPNCTISVVAYYEQGDEHLPRNWNCRPYRYLTGLAQEGWFARFPLDLGASWRAGILLAEAGRDPARPLIAMHVRQPSAQTSGEPHKNLNLANMAALMRLLQQEVEAQFLVMAGQEGVPEMLRPLVLTEMPFDESLQNCAALIAHCDLFIGGDSGPGHLAAAMDCPVISLRSPAAEWVAGPFNWPERVMSVHGWSEPHQSGLLFDSELVLHAVRRMLMMSITDRSNVRRPPNLTTGEAAERSWAELDNLTEFLGGSGNPHLRMAGPLHLFKPALEGILYLLERGNSVEWLAPWKEVVALAQSCEDRFTFRRTSEFSLVAELPDTFDQGTNILPKHLARWVEPRLLLGPEPPDPEVLEQLYRRSPMKPRLHLSLMQYFRPIEASWNARVMALMEGLTQRGLKVVCDSGMLEELARSLPDVAQEQILFSSPDRSELPASMNPSSLLPGLSLSPEETPLLIRPAIAIPAASDWEIHYIVFAPSWHQFLAKRGIDNSERISGRPVGGEGLAEYLRYLRYSAISMLTGDGAEFTFVVDLVTIGPWDGAEDAVRKAWTGLPVEKLRVEPIVSPTIQTLIDRELSRPLSVHKSPNSIHEYVLYHLLVTSQAERLAIIDVDTLFIKPGLCSAVANRFAQEPGLCVASFLEDGVSGPDTTNLRRRRMHTVALFCAPKRICDRLPLARELEVFLEFESRLGLIRDPAIQRHYFSSGRMDSLALLTEQLLIAGPPNPLLDLNCLGGSYFEADGLVLGNEHFIHAKYFEPHQLSTLKARLSAHPDDLRNFMRTFNLVISCQGEIFDTVNFQSSGMG